MRHRVPLHSRATALVGVLVALVIATAVVIAVTADRTAPHPKTTGSRAFYAAEGAMNMALREVFVAGDEDGSGAAGSIAAPGSPLAVGPSSVGGAAVTEASTVGTTTTLSTVGESTAGSRKLVAELVTPGTAVGSTRVVFAQAGEARPARTIHLSTSWSTPVHNNALSGQPNWIAAAPMNTVDTFVGVMDANARLWLGLINSAGNGSYTQVCADVSGTGSKAFDISVDPATGQGLAVWYDASVNSYKHRTHNGTSLSAEGTLPVLLLLDTGQTARLFARPSGGQTMCLVGTDNKALQTLSWNGSNWSLLGAAITGSLPTDAHAPYAGAYEENSDEPMVAFSESGGGLKTRKMLLGLWLLEYPVPGVSAPMNYVQLISRPGTNDLFICGLDTSQRLWAARWNGSAWGAATQLATGVGFADRRAFDIQSSADGSVVAIVYAGGDNVIRRRTWTGAAWSAATTLATLDAQVQIIQLQRGLAGSTLHCLASTATRKLHHTSWTGSTTLTTVVTDTLSADDHQQRFFLLPGASARAITTWKAAAP